MTVQTIWKYDVTAPCLRHQHRFLVVTCQSDFLETIAGMADAQQEAIEVDRAEGSDEDCSPPRMFDLVVDAWSNSLASGHPSTPMCIGDLGLTRAGTVCGRGVNSHVAWEPNWQTILTKLGFAEHQHEFDIKLISRILEDEC